MFTLKKDKNKVGLRKKIMQERKQKRLENRKQTKDKLSKTDLLKKYEKYKVERKKEKK